MRVLLYFCCVLIWFPCVNFPAVSAKRENSGPYKSTVVKVEKCEKTTYPIDPNPPFTMAVEVYNVSGKNFLRGNLTVFRDNKQVKLKLKSYVWQDGKWKLMYLMNHIGCHGVLLHMITVAMGLEYDRENCGFLKGSYTFKDIDPNMMQHIWAPTMEYGRILWFSETISGSTSYTCYEYETSVTPI